MTRRCNAMGNLSIDLSAMFMLNDNGDDASRDSSSFPVFASNRRRLQSPVSMTCTIPGIVTLLSAIFVDRITLRKSGGVREKTWASSRTRKQSENNPVQFGSIGSYLKPTLI